MSNLRGSVGSGDLIQALEATRDQIAADLDVCESMRDRAALYSRLTDVLQRIEEARPAEQEGDSVDEIAQRRSARRAGSGSHPARSKRSG